MDPDQLQAIAARDQLWSSLKVLVPEINSIASGQFDDSPRQHHLIQILAQIVSAELTFRKDDARNAVDDPPGQTSD
jgi:hypothetical protein